MTTHLWPAAGACRLRRHLRTQSTIINASSACCANASSLCTIAVSRTGTRDRTAIASETHGPCECVSVRACGACTGVCVGEPRMFHSVCGLDACVSCNGTCLRDKLEASELPVSRAGLEHRVPSSKRALQLSLCHRPVDARSALMHVPSGHVCKSLTIRRGRTGLGWGGTADSAERAQGRAWRHSHAQAGTLCSERKRL